MIKVWQRDWSIDRDPMSHFILGYELDFQAKNYLKDFFATDYVMVAEIEVNDIEDALHLTGLDPDNWINNPQVTSHNIPSNMRAIAVGDVLEMNGIKFLVRGFGFLEV